MKNLTYVIFVFALISCNQKPHKITAESVIIDSIITESGQTENDSTEQFQTQADINEACYNDYIANEDSVENDYERLLNALPKYRKEFQKEKVAWEKYQKAVREVAGCEDHGSSTPMYVTAVLSQATKIRGISLHNMYLHTQGKDISTSMTKITPAMIEEAYSAYIKAVGEDEYIEQKAKYQESLRKEHKCWDELLECRKEISQILTGEIKNVYDISTNQMLRTKLYQLKNQNRDLGLTSGEIMKCALPENCSDKVLLEYPGFDKIWAKHCEDLEWYPQFD